MVLFLKRPVRTCVTDLKISALALDEQPPVRHHPHGHLDIRLGNQRPLQFDEKSTRIRDRERCDHKESREELTAGVAAHSYLLPFPEAIRFDKDGGATVVAFAARAYSHLPQGMQK